MIRTVLHSILDLHGCSEHALGRNLTEAIHPDALAASHPSRAVVQRGELNIRFDQRLFNAAQARLQPKTSAHLSRSKDERTPLCPFKRPAFFLIGFPNQRIKHKVSETKAGPRQNLRSLGGYSSCFFELWRRCRSSAFSSAFHSSIRLNPSSSACRSCSLGS